MANLEDALGTQIGSGEYREDLIKAMSCLLSLLLKKISDGEDDMDELTRTLKKRVMKNTTHSGFPTSFIPSPS